MSRSKFWGEITFASKGLKEVNEALKNTPFTLISHLEESKVKISDNKEDIGTKFTVVTVGCKKKSEMQSLKNLADSLRAL